MSVQGVAYQGIFVGREECRDSMGDNGKLERASQRKTNVDVRVTEGLCGRTGAMDGGKVGEVWAQLGLESGSEALMVKN